MRRPVLLAASGTDLAFADVVGIRGVRVSLDDVYGMDLAGLAEGEVLARGE